jgi:heme-binding protein
MRLLLFRELISRSKSMVSFVPAMPRLLVGGIAAAAISGAMLFGTTGSAAADPTDPTPPNCTAADLAQVSAGVAASASIYLYSHPDVNAYFTGLKGQPRDDIRDQLQQYMDANPQAHADLESIRQPLTDFRSRCGMQQ